MKNMGSLGTMKNMGGVVDRHRTKAAAGLMAESMAESGIKAPQMNTGRHRFVDDASSIGNKAPKPDTPPSPFPPGSKPLSSPLSQAPSQAAQPMAEVN